MQTQQKQRFLLQTNSVIPTSEYTIIIPVVFFFCCSLFLQANNYRFRHQLSITFNGQREWVGDDEGVRVHAALHQTHHLNLLLIKYLFN